MILEGQLLLRFKSSYLQIPIHVVLNNNVTLDGTYHLIWKAMTPWEDLVQNVLVQMESDENPVDVFSTEVLLVHPQLP